MANFDNIIQEINTNLPDNNTQAITAAKLRNTLIDLTNQIDTVQDDFENNVNQTISDLPSNLIVDNLNSTNATKALSANQGNVLNKSIIWKDYEYKQDVSGSFTNISKFVGIPIGTTIYVYPDSTTIRLNASNTYNYLPNTYHTTSVEVVQFSAIGAGTAHFILNPNSLPKNAVITNSVADSAITTAKVADNAITTDKIADNAVSESKLDSNAFYKLNELNGYSLNETKTYSAATGGANYQIYSFGGKLLIKDGQTFYMTVSSPDITIGNNGIRAFYNSSSTLNPNYHYINGNGTRYKFTASGDITYYHIHLANCSFVEGATSAEVTVLIETDPYKFIIPNDYVSFDNINFKEEIPTSKNLLNPSKTTSGSYINYNNGNVATFASYSCTDFIPVNTQGLYFNKAVFSAGAAIGSYVYNPDKTGKRRLTSQYVFQEGDEGCFVRYSFQTSQLSTAQVEVGTSGSSYVPYTSKTVISSSVLPTLELSEEDFDTIQTNVDNSLAEDKNFGQKIDIDLPDKIYAVRGDTLQLFYQGMLKCVNPENYNVVVNCKYGTQYHRYYEFACPSDATLETRPLTITVKDNNNNVLATKSTSLQIVKAPVSPATNKNILCIGDSLTAGGLWPAEANRRLKANDGTPTGNGISNVTFVGRLSKEQGGETANYEGKSGYGWKDFVEGRNPKFRFYIDNNATVNEGDVYSNSGYQYTVIEINTIEGQLTILTSTSNVNNIPQESGTLTKVSGSGDATITYTSMNSDSDNPLWDGTNNRISFQYYLETVCGYAAGISLDAVYVMLSWNQISPNQTNWNTILGYIKTFADTLHSEYPTAKLKLMAVQYPSMKLMMPTYGANGGYGDIYGMLNTIYNMNQTYQAFANSTETSGTSGDAYNTFVEFVNVSSQVDSDYNMPISNKKVNTRNPATEPYANNGVHPGNYGYLQIADIAYRNIVASFCQ